MQITTPAIVAGRILPVYGKKGNQFNQWGMPTYSWPVQIKNAPKDTQTFALILEDKDAAPVCGFAWIHWLVANLIRTELVENESILATDFLQGANSWAGPLGFKQRVAASCYGGMAPPNAPHYYELYVYALDQSLALQHSFYLNELCHAMRGHILAQATIGGWYDN